MNYYEILGFLIFLFPPQVDIQEELSVDVVVLDIIAVDSAGNYVDDLTVNDFVVKDNRKKVTPTLFEIIDHRFQSRPEAVDEWKNENFSVGWDEPPENMPRYIFVLDAEAGQLAEAETAIKQLDRFLAELELSGPVAMQLHGLTYGPISRKWTSDPAQIREDLQRYKEEYLDRRTGSEGTGGLLESGHSGRRTMGNPGNRDLEELEHDFVLCKDYEGSVPRQDFLQCMREALDSFIEEQKHRTEQGIDNLYTLTRSFSDSKGMKMLLLVSPGFSLTPGQAGYQLHDQYIDVGDVTDGLATASSFEIQSYESEFNRVIHACIANRIMFYTMDLFNFDSGFQRQNSVAFSGSSKRSGNIYKNYGLELTRSLEVLAEQSGGRFIRGVNLETPFQKIVSEPPFVYLLAYPSPEGKEGKFRRIKVKCKRKGVKLLYRKGYVGR